MGVMSPHNHWSYFTSGSSVSSGAARGTSVPGGGTAHTYGTWTQIHAGFTYPVEAFTVNINNVTTSAATRNAYFDIGIGTSNSTVTPLVTRLNGGHASPFMGRNYWIPVRIPPDVAVWARQQGTTASSAGTIYLSTFGGNMNPGSFPSFAGMDGLGYTSASTTGTAITPGASGAEGAWTQIVESTTGDYGGLMVSPMFVVDTTMATGLLTYCFDVGIGASGQERTVGENLTWDIVNDTLERASSFSLPTFTGIPVGSRICVRASCSGTADTSTSVMVYGFKH